MSYSSEECLFFVFVFVFNWLYNLELCELGFTLLSDLQKASLTWQNLTFKLSLSTTCQVLCQALLENLKQVLLQGEGFILQHGLIFKVCQGVNEWLKRDFCSLLGLYVHYLPALLDFQFISSAATFGYVSGSLVLHVCSLAFSQGLTVLYSTD